MSYVDSVISLIMMPIGVGRFIGRPLESGRRRGVETTRCCNTSPRLACLLSTFHASLSHYLVSILITQTKECWDIIQHGMAEHEPSEEAVTREENAAILSDVTAH